METETETETETVLENRFLFLIDAGLFANESKKRTIPKSILVWSSFSFLFSLDWFSFFQDKKNTNWKLKSTKEQNRKVFGLNVSLCFMLFAIWKDSRKILQVDQFGKEQV